MSHPDDPPHGLPRPADRPGGGDELHHAEPAAGAHVDSDTLALVALDESVGAAANAHIAGCSTCRAEVDSLARVVILGRTLDVSAELAAPPRRVWERIAGELGIDSALLPMGVTTLPSRSAATDGSTAALPVSRSGSGEGSSPVADLDERRHQPPAPSRSSSRRGRFGRGLLVAAAVGGILAGVGITLGWEALDGPGVVASAALQPLDGHEADGEAELVGDDPKRELKVQIDVDPPAGTYFQVWLMSPDATRMIPVGVLQNGDGFWRVPAGLDLSAFPLVDVSVEPFDGNEAHSGDSVVRGSLSSA